MLQKSAITILVSVFIGMSVPSTRSTISSGYSAPHGHITNALTSHRHSPLNLIGEGYTSSSSSPSRSISPSSEDSDKWSSYLRAKDELIGQKDQIIDRYSTSLDSVSLIVVSLLYTHHGGQHEKKKCMSFCRWKR